jgi:hypothetical protein
LSAATLKSQSAAGSGLAFLTGVTGTVALSYSSRALNRGGDSSVVTAIGYGLPYAQQLGQWNHSDAA